MYHSPSNLVWIDLEMTGLDPNIDSILQMAIVVTTPSLTYLDSKEWYIKCDETKLSKMNSQVQAMHAGTGLLEIIKIRGKELVEVEKEAINWLKPLVSPEAIMCGNSIWADRKFIERQMKKFNKMFHYRMVDVSSIKVLVAMWKGDGHLYQKPTDGKHDAIFDIKESINELAHYKKNLFD